AQKKLEAVNIAGRAAFKARHEGNAVFAGCTVFTAVTQDAHLSGANGTCPFFDLMYGVDVLKSGMHHPDGALWIRRPELRHEEHKTPVQLERVAPTLLTLLGLPLPAGFAAPLFTASPQEEAA